MICEPLYSNRRTSKLSKLENYRLSMQDMSQFVMFLSALMDLGAYAHMFCSALQFNTRSNLLIREVEVVVKHEEIFE